MENRVAVLVFNKGGGGLKYRILEARPSWSHAKSLQFVLSYFTEH